MNKINRRVIILALVLLVIPMCALFAAHGVEGEEEGMTEKMTMLVLQVGVIIFAAKVMGILASKVKIPSVIGELLAGVIIGPYLLGHFVLPGFPQGFFPLPPGSFPVSPELYGLATIASIILLFLSGLETDLNMFLAYSVKGAIIGVSGVIFSFFVGLGIGVLVTGDPIMSPVPLFLGVLSVATSVGITARILSEQRKMESPEGVTILASAVIDDVLGVILLAIVLGMVSVLSGSATAIPWGKIGIMAGKAIAIWLGVTTLGLIFARVVSGFLKTFKSRVSIAVMSFGLALLLAGLFEKAGLAMIIGAYIMGLALSRTDINFLIQEKLHPLHEFLVPIFFCVIGMLVDVHIFTDTRVLFFGLLFAGAGIVSKIVGCGVPALFLNFNFRGAMRIGVGMIPRGEVALIIAGIGMAGGFIDKDIFGMAIMMTLLTTIIPPPILTSLFKNPKRGTRKEAKGVDTTVTVFDFSSLEMANLARTKIIDSFQDEGFYTQIFDMEHPVFQIRKDDVFLTLNAYPLKLEITSDRADTSYVKTLVYESFLGIFETLNQIKDLAKPEELRKELSETDGDARVKFNLFRELKAENVILSLKGESKEEIIIELLDRLEKNRELLDRKLCQEAVFAREESMSTGMQDGVAIPHGKCDGVSQLVTAIGLKPEGIDYGSIDGKDSNIFIMTLSPKNTAGPHVQFLASVSAVLSQAKYRAKILKAKVPQEVLDVMRQGGK